ncbi:MAG: protein kinase [Vicinamibacteria bacterium]
MTLATGTRLGPYEVLGPLGAGGMGEVYRAKDTRLDRSVAIKVLPSHLSSNPDLRARFEREARAVSSLNHPHICTLHDVGHQDGIDYIVMELVEGETLLDRLKKGLLPLDQVLRYGIEIADALDKAHRQGVVHRDLKPGNVMLTKAGAKLMDFGLAKRGMTGDGTGGVSALPTQEKPLTEAGSLLGTFQYMSPEQLEGRDADARSDIWALGCVLYEMTTGKRAFEGKGKASLISAIMTSEPQPAAQVQPMTPPALDRLVKVCLAKDPDDRLQTTHDVMQELKWIAEGAAESIGPASRSRERLLWTAGIVVVATAAWLAGSILHRGSQATQVVQFEVRPPEGTELQPYLAVSPDGSHIAFTAKDRLGVDHLFAFALGTGKTEQLAGTAGAAVPFWSPDSRSAGFYAGSKLKRIEIGGGAPQTITTVSEERGATWRPDGWIVFAESGEGGLHRVRSTGGTAEGLTTPEAVSKEFSHRWPHTLPDGRLLYMALVPGTASISLRPADGRGVPRRILDVASAPIYDSGHLLFVRDGALRAQSFDPRSATLAGEPVTLAEDVASGWEWVGGIPVAAAGGVLAVRAGHIGESRLTWLDRNGRQLGTLGAEGVYQEPALSRDGRFVAMSVGSGTAEEFLGILDVASGALQRLTFGKELLNAPCWSSDGRSVAYASNRGGTYDIYLKPVSNTGAEETLVRAGSTSWSDDLSRDGRFLLYENRGAQSRIDLWVLALKGERRAIPFVRTDANEAHGAFSPDGRFIAYASDSTGQSEVYVRAFPSGEGPWQVSAAGGDQPRWRGDGRELFYVSPDSRLMAASISGAAAFRADTPRPLFSLRIRPLSLDGSRNEYDVTPDGQRFLVDQLLDDPAKATITVIVNWAARLKP